MSIATTRSYKADKTAASEIWQSLKEGVRADIQAANTHYAQYEGKVQDAATKVNDTYLKAFSEEAGVQSYGEAADLLIAWYLEKSRAKRKNVLDKCRELLYNNSRDGQLAQLV